MTPRAPVAPDFATLAELAPTQERTAALYREAEGARQELLYRAFAASSSPVGRLRAARLEAEIERLDERIHRLGRRLFHNERPNR